MSIDANETEIKYWTDYANPRDGICFRKEDAHTLVHEHYELGRIKAENDKLREWCSDFWKWADPPFALKSGTFDEYMTLVERAMKLGIEVNE